MNSKSALKNASGKIDSKNDRKSSRRSKSLDRTLDDNSGDSKEERRYKRQFLHLISEKNEQIEKLIKRVTTLHSLNNEFAVEHEKLENQLVSARQRCADYEMKRDKGCDSCRSLCEQNKAVQVENERLANDNDQLLNDVSMMKVLIYRLNVQLESYQETVRKHDADATHSRKEVAAVASYEHIESINWGSVSTHVLAPLLNAYQETIKEKTSLVKAYEAELNQITGRIKDVLTENEQLYAQIDQMKQYDDVWKEEKVRLQAQLDVCREKAEIHSKRADLAKEKLIEVMRCYEQKIQSQTIDIQRLQDAYSRLRGEQSDCRTMHQQPELLAESLKECQRLFEEAKGQYEAEKAKFTDEISQLKESKQKIELDNQNVKLKIGEHKSIVESQYEKVGILEKKVEKLRHKCIRLQQSREMIKSRLRSAITWNRKVEAATKSVSWQDLRKIEQLLVQKESQLQQLRNQCQNEIDKLQRKLTRRDELLRKILLNKVKKK